MAKTKEEVAKIREGALKHLEEHKDDLEKFKNKSTDLDAKWANEIALLERRVETNIIDISIGDGEGETVAIRASLSDYEAGEIAKLDKERLKLDPEKPKELEEINKITYTILAQITANPIMTPEWFAENREKYSTEDMLSVLLSYFEQMTARAKRISKIQNFRG